MPAQISEKESAPAGGTWLDYADAVRHTRLSLSYLRKLVMAGEIPHRKVGKRVLFRVDELDGWINENRPSAA